MIFLYGEKPFSELDCNMVQTENGNVLTTIRLVNEQVLDNIENDSIIEAQVVAFAVDVNVYQDKTAYANPTEQIIYIAL